VYLEDQVESMPEEIRELRRNLGNVAADQQRRHDFVARAAALRDRIVTVGDVSREDPVSRLEGCSGSGSSRSETRRALSLENSHDTFWRRRSGSTSLLSGSATPTQRAVRRSTAICKTPRSLVLAYASSPRY
jgi:hypothetical protein